jgi:hypothetical protein
MKTCGNCWRVNTDEAEFCQSCGQKFSVWNQPPVKISEEKRGESSIDFITLAPPFRRKIFLIILAWFIAALCVFPFWGLMLFAGPKLILIFPVAVWTTTGKYGLIVAWAIYVILTISIISVRRRWLFRVLYGVLVALLTVNVLGCYTGVANALHDLK